MSRKLFRKLKKKTKGSAQRHWVSDSLPSFKESTNYIEIQIQTELYMWQRLYIVGHHEPRTTRQRALPWLKPPENYLTDQSIWNVLFTSFSNTNSNRRWFFLIQLGQIFTTLGTFLQDSSDCSLDTGRLRRTPIGKLMLRRLTTPHHRSRFLTCIFETAPMTRNRPGEWTPVLRRNCIASGLEEPHHTYEKN